jgi:hypothetical protein
MLVGWASMAGMKMVSGSMRCVNDNGHCAGTPYFFFRFASRSGPSMFS